MLIPGGPFTLFAPVDLAFDALPPGYLNYNFLDLEHSRRKYILLYNIKLKLLIFIRGFAYRVIHGFIHFIHNVHFSVMIPMFKIRLDILYKTRTNDGDEFLKYSFKIVSRAGDLSYVKPPKCLSP